MARISRNAPLHGPATRRPPGQVPVSVPAGGHRPLLVTTDTAVLDDVLRVAAAAGVELEVAADAGAAASGLTFDRLVIVGPDQADGMVRTVPSREADVVLVDRDPDDAAVWRRAHALGAERVVVLPTDEAWLATRLADAVEGTLEHAVVAAVVGGRGGAGASVLACALGLAARRAGRSVVLVDLDPLGGGLDLALGLERASGLRWPDLADSRGRLSATALIAELPARQGVPVVSWDRGDRTAIPAEAVTAVLSAVRRGGDLVVLDLPRWPDPTRSEALRLCSTAFLVVPADVRSVAAATQVAAGLGRTVTDRRVVSRASPSGLTGVDVAAALGLPLAAELADEPRLGGRLDRGDPPGLDGKSPLATVCRRLAADLLDEEP